MAANKGRGAIPVRPQPMFQTGGVHDGYGWWFNTGWTNGTVYFSPRFTAYFHRNLDNTEDIADLIADACGLIAEAIIAVATGGLAAAVGVALAAVCNVIWDYWHDDFSNNVKEAVRRKPDGCLTMKLGPGAVANGGVDFDDVANKNKFCTKAENKEG